MKEYTEKNYNDLMNLIKKDEAFFFKDFTLDDVTYRIFNYRLASWTSFMEPSALNCRGIMFDITNEDDIKLVSLPPEKFFNYEEGGVDHTQCEVGDKMVKMDGSLISTYLHKGELQLKSKGSLDSIQANDAMDLLNRSKNQDFKEQLTNLVSQGYTVNLEYTAPDNKIVLMYPTKELTVLSVRNHENGHNLFATKLKELLLKEGKYDAIIKNMVEHVSLHGVKLNQIEFINNIRAEQEGEGYVIEFIKPNKESYLSKAKNLKYVDLHRVKDSVNSTKNLFEVIIREASDDLRSMFTNDEYVLNKIKEMEDHVQPIFNHIIKTVEEFTAENKSLGRKEFALKAQEEQPKLLSLLMNAYLDKPNDFKEFAIKRRVELFGVKEVIYEVDEDAPKVEVKRKMKM